MKRPKSLEDLVKVVLKNMAGSGRPAAEEIGAAWSGAAGERASGHSRPVALKRSVLVVNVDSSPWLYELTTKKKEILAALGEKLAGRKPKDIRFRIGAVK